ncbi:hypothetical protein GLOIN_2v1582958, partial [Rhizophagus irregularis DAOM 181602=DAOM 197198]
MSIQEHFFKVFVQSDFCLNGFVFVLSSNLQSVNRSYLCQICSYIVLAPIFWYIV